METWARLLDQCLSTGGVKKACSVLKRVGPKLYVGDGACLPLDSICLHLEKAALVGSKCLYKFGILTFVSLHKMPL